MAVDRKAVAYGFLAVFVVYAVYFALNADKMAENVATTSIFGNLFIYIASNAEHLIIAAGIIFLHKTRPLRAIAASVLFVTALDLVSFPHCVPITGQIPQINALCSDSFLFGFLAKILSVPVAWSFVYIVVPIGLMFLAAYLLGYLNFVKMLIQKAKGK